MKKGLIIFVISIFYFLCIDDADGGITTKSPLKPPSGAAQKPTLAPKKSSNITTKATSKNNSKFAMYKVNFMGEQKNNFF